MYDIHCHILYGVDDGADTLQESLEMAQIAYESGTKAVAVTSHSNCSPSNPNFWDDDFKERFNKLSAAITEAGIPLKLLTGQEIFCKGNFIEYLKAGKLITLNNSRYPLVEFPFTEHSDDVFRKIQKLISEGFVPVIAHPERYSFVAESFESLIKLKKMGCLIQLNMGSLKGKLGKTAHDLAVKTLSYELADVVASDGHSPFMRTPCLGEAHEYITERFSAKTADLLLSKNPLTILKNQKL